MRPDSIKYPEPSDREMAELLNLERQVHSLVTSIFRDFGKVGTHEIGHALHMIQVLAHDIEYLAEQQYQQYEAADQEVKHRILAEPLDEVFP